METNYRQFTSPKNIEFRLIFLVAKTNDPVYGGFCLINDAYIAAKRLLQELPGLKILIIDLDLHQGYGNSEAVNFEKNVVIFDMSMLIRG